MVTKDECRSYLRRVQKKAEDAIVKKNEPLIEKGYNQTLKADKEFARFINLAQQCIDIGAELYQAYNDLKPKNGSWYQGLSGPGASMPETFKAKYAAAYPETAYGKAVKAFEEELSQVKNEYVKIFNKIDSCKNGNKALAMLEEYGFDTSWLFEKSPTAVNTDLLFPCKEKGL